MRAPAASRVEGSRVTLSSILTSPASISALSRVRDSAMRRAAAAWPRKRSSRSPTFSSPTSKTCRPSGADKRSGGRRFNRHVFQLDLIAPRPRRLQARCLAFEFTSVPAGAADWRRSRPRAARRGDRAPRQSPPRPAARRLCGRRGRAASPRHGRAYCRNSRRRCVRRNPRRDPAYVSISSGVPE